jgi:hypothetical protein
VSRAKAAGERANNKAEVRRMKDEGDLGMKGLPK